VQLPIESSSIAVPAEFVAALGFILLEAQLLFVALLAPAYAASAIAKEKERGSLSLLLTTELSDREIVFAKSASRTALMLTAVAAGLPILLLPYLYGSVSLELLAGGQVLTLGTTLLATGIGIDAAVHSPDSRTALVRAYCYSAVLIAGLVVLTPLTPFAVLAYEAGVLTPPFLKVESSGARLLLALGYACLQGLLGLAFVARAAAGLRTIEPGAGPPAPTSYPEPPRGRASPIVVEPPSPPRPPLPPVDDANPVLWKERHTRPSGDPPLFRGPLQWLTVAVAVAAIGLFAVGAWDLLSHAVIGLDPETVHHFAPTQLYSNQGVSWLLASGELAAALYLLQVGGAIAASVAGERERSTLDSLLATTLPRRSILWGKTRACLERWSAFGVAAATAIGCAFGVQGGLKFGFAALAAMAAAFWLTIACGAWLSVRCQSPGQAFRLFLLPAAVVLASPLVVWVYSDWSRPAAAMRAVLWAGAVAALLGSVVWLRAVARLARNA
jgi:ABC-type transport system involved in multi-copper enzyme maturation permease subunit